ncbi:MAG TPA: hypothetical protein VFR47_23545 [Anaerolineales bacterium]|nr:hypothetical protein [Anaerolineales bacterium]
MKDEEVTGLVGRIRQELEELQRVFNRIQEGWELFRRSNDDLYLDGVALNLHGFYSGFERLFTHIAETIDGKLPHGAEWHKLLLGQMKTEIPGIRPAVISIETGKFLDELRRFRHIIRNVYTHHIDPERLKELVEGSSKSFAQLNAEISAFAAFLEQ